MTETKLPVVYSPPKEDEDVSLVESALLNAAVNYIATANRRYQAGISLTREGIETALGVIRDGLGQIQSQTGLDEIPANPRKLGTLVKKGLELRADQLSRGQKLLSGLSDPSGPNSERTAGYDLAISPTLLREAKEETYKFWITPKPDAIRELTATVTGRQTVIPTMALALVEHSLGYPPDPGDTDQFGLRKQHFPHLSGQSVIGRGAITAAALKKVKPRLEFDPDPLFINQSGLQALIEAVKTDGIDDDLLRSAAQALVDEALFLPPAAMETAAATLVDYGRQTVTRTGGWLKRTPRETTSMLPIKMTEYFSDLPVIPLTTARLVMNPENLKAALAADREHIWKEASVFRRGREKFALPSPPAISSALLIIRRSDSPESRPLRENLETALKAWQRFHRARERYPQELVALKERISQLDKPPARVLVLQPELSATVFLTLKGRTTADRRKLNFYRTALETNQRLKHVGLQTGETGIGSGSAASAARRAAVKEYLLIQKGNLDHEISSAQGGLDRIRASVAQEGTWLDFAGFRPPAPSPLSEVFRPPAKFELEARLRLARIIKQQMATKPDQALPPIFQSATKTELIEFLQWRLTHPLSGRLRTKSVKRTEVGLNILNSNPDIGIKFWRDWVLADLGYEENRLTTALRYYETLDNLKSKAQGTEDCLAVASDYRALMITYQQRFSGDLDSLSNWIMATTLDETEIHRPDLETHLNQARQLVKAFWNIERGVSFRVPGPAELSEVIGAVRAGISAAGRKTKKAEADAELMKLADKMQPPSTPKSSRGTKTERANRVLQIFMDAVKDKNPLVPVELTQGKTLGELMEATTRRADIAEAHLYRGELEGKIAQNEKLYRELRENVDWGNRALELQRLNAKRDTLTHEVRDAEDNLVNSMLRLGIAVADPETIKLLARKK